MPSNSTPSNHSDRALPYRIPVVDLFSGPGGLSEGFASLGTLEAELDGAFDPVLAYEKDAHAVRTLRFRKLFHAARHEGFLSDYLSAIATDPDHPEDHLSDDLNELFAAAGGRVRDITLQRSERPRVAAEVRAATVGKPWVLLGGPPCQAYSLVGRARNRGVVSYDAAKDERNTLYEEYLHVLATAAPDVFILENVKGLLSATVENRWIFGKMLSDLAEPGNALRMGPDGVRYRLYSLVDGTELPTSATQPDYVRGEALNLRSTVVRMEDYGVPQARHRVLLMGIRSDLNACPRPLTPSEVRTPIEYVISDLPALRSRFSDKSDSSAQWARFIRCAPFAHWREHLLAAANGSGRKALDQLVKRLMRVEVPSANFGGSLVQGRGYDESTARWLDGEVRRGFDQAWRSQWRSWFRGGMGNVRWHANHQSRGHMRDDLYRYVFASSYAWLSGSESPRIRHFPEALHPTHRNIGRAVTEGLFADRFRVQMAGRPSTTITSHIHKDGHYFIHFDPTQARSFTVREAARAQTFPDSYLFLGPRTEQFRQVGNAVPPYLAAQVAKVVLDVLRQAKRL